MKKKGLLSRIPRPVKAVVCFLLILVLLVAVYCFLGCPTTYMQEFRRAEKAHLVGPSTIVHDTKESLYDRMLVGETEYGICFFGSGEVHYSGSHFPKTQYYFFYREKTGDVTVLSPGYYRSPFWVGMDLKAKLPIYIFSDLPDAIRAEIEFQVTGNKSISTTSGSKEIPYDEHFTANASKIADGVFLCELTGESDSRIAAMEQIALMSSGPHVGGRFEDEVIPITVRFYDSNGQLIAEKQTELRTTDNQ